MRIGFLLACVLYSAGLLAFMIVRDRELEHPPYPSAPVSFPKPLRLAETEKLCIGRLTDETRQKWRERCDILGGFTSYSRYYIECWSGDSEIRTVKDLLFRVEAVDDGRLSLTTADGTSL